MNSTKRKFHNLLNSLTSSASSTKPASGQINNAAERSPEAKRRRTTQPYAALLSTRHRSGTSHGSLLSKRDDRSAQTTQTAGEQRTVSNYAPWDRGQFLSRLRTFRHVDKWSAKPAEINEVQWAKRGWSCVGKERVSCLGGCGREIYVKFEERSEADEGDDGIASFVVGAEDELVRRYAEMIVTEHDNDCPWRKRGCDDTIHRLPLHHPATTIAALESRYRSLVSMESELPSNTVCPDGTDMNSVIETLPEGFPSPSDFDADGSTKENKFEHVNKDALALSILGWEAETGHIKGLVTCSACFRRLGLWLFQKRKSSSLTDTDEMKDEAATITSLDVIREHRDYCPWINSASQNGDKPGWEILVSVLRTAHHFRSRSSPRAAVSAPQTQQGIDEQGDPNEQAQAPVEEEDERSLRDRKDKERFAKLRKLRKAFDVKSSRKVNGKDVKRKMVA